MKNLPVPVKLASWLIVCVLGTMILIYAKEFFLPIVIASLLSMLLYPVYKKLLHWKFPNAIAVIISVLLIITVLIAVVFLVSKELTGIINNLGKLSGQINDRFSKLQNYITEYTQSSSINESIANVKIKLIDSIGEMVSGTIVGTTSVMSMLLLIIVYIFCFLVYNKSFKNFAFALLAAERQTQANHLIHNIQKLVQNYLLGLLTVILIIGGLNTIGLLIIGVDHAIFFAFFVAMLTVIPYVGITIGALITAFYTLLTKDSALPAIAVMSVLFVVQFMESNFITPRIVGSKVSVNPFIAIVVLLIGGQIWGIPGMILSVPLTAILKVLLDTYPSTQALGYFIGSELTDDKNDASLHIGHSHDSDVKDK